MKTNWIPWRLAIPAVAVAALGVLVAVGPARAQNAAGQTPGTVSWLCPRTGQTVTVPATARQVAWTQGAGPGWGRGQGWGYGHGRGYGYGRGMMGW